MFWTLHKLNVCSFINLFSNADTFINSRVGLKKILYSAK